MNKKQPGSFDLLFQSTDSEARVSYFHTRRGGLELPLFCPVATQASVKSIDAQELEDLNVSMILANAYHLHLRPGEKLIKEAGGLHSFMNWSRPILTDSGGYQVFSLADVSRINEEGVLFKSHINGDKILMTPESSIDIQCQLGADIIMAFDHCPPSNISKEESVQSMEQTFRWLGRSYEAYNKNFSEHSPLLFGIVQGGMYKDLRAISLDQVESFNLKGIAVGGMSVGESKEKMQEILHFIGAKLPKNKPRYLMGVGLPEDIINAVDCGFDLFDCVLPTRMARMGKLFTWDGVINIRNSQHRESHEPLEVTCTCLTCQNYTKSYLRHLFMSRELLSYRLTTIHNIHFYMSLMKAIKDAIRNQKWTEFKAQALDRLQSS